MKNKWVKFTTETGVVCGYNTYDFSIKVFSKMPKTYYHSVLNEAGKYFEDTILPTLK